MNKSQNKMDGFNKEIQFSKCNLPIVRTAREELLKRFKKLYKKGCLKLDYRSLTYTYNYDRRDYRTVDFGFKVGTDFAGTLRIGIDSKSEIPVYGCCLFIDGTTFEFIEDTNEETHRVISIYQNGDPIGSVSEHYGKYGIPEEWHIKENNDSLGTIETGDFILLGKWWWVSSAIPNTAVIKNSNYQDLTVSIDRRSDTIFDFPNTILKLVTLYGLWKPKWAKNDDTVIPSTSPKLPEETERLYFAVNICFRCILFDSFFSSRSGD